MNIKSLTSGGAGKLLIGFGVSAGVGIVCRYFYSQDYLIPYVNYTIKTDVLIPAGLAVVGILGGVLMKSDTKYLMLGLGIGGASTAVVNYFLPKTETSYPMKTYMNTCNPCSQKFIT